MAEQGTLEEIRRGEGQGETGARGRCQAPSGRAKHEVKGKPRIYTSVP